MQTLLEKAIKEYNRLAMVIDANPGICVYCGDGSTCQDHIAPRAYSGEHTVTVPACTRCNLLLGTFPVASIRERSLQIYNKERIKNKKLLRGVKHNMEEYGYGLATALQAREERRQLLYARLHNLAVGGIGDSRFLVLE